MDINMTLAFPLDMKARTACSRLGRVISPWYLSTVEYDFSEPPYEQALLDMDHTGLGEVIGNQIKATSPLRNDQNLTDI